MTTPQQGARSLSQSLISQGYKPQALHTYYNIEGKPIYWKIRCKHPTTKEKSILPMHMLGDHYTLGEPKLEGKKPLYNLPGTLKASENEAIYLCEGELCVDKLTELGLTATTTGGATSAEKADWSPLQNKSIIIWPDNDTNGSSYAQTCADILKPMNCHVEIIDVAILGLPEKGDVIDWLETNPNSTATDIKALKKSTYQAPTTTKKKTEEKKKSAATFLANLALKNIELFQDTNKNTYARSKQTHEICALESQSFKDSLIAAYYDLTKSCVGKQAVEEAVNTLSAKARMIEPKEQVFQRIAQVNDKYYIDLAQANNSKAIEISAADWKIIDKPPCNFIRSDTMQPINDPTINGDLDLIWQYINVPEDAKILITTWLLECLRYDTPFPILELVGEQGSAKSTTQTILRRIIDPNSCNLRSAPKNREDIFICAGQNYLVSYENLSHLKSTFQDALCTVATGSGFSKRKLRTDIDECVIKVKNPIILNGISATVTAQDLVDRTISVELPVIKTRQAVADLFEHFEQQLPAILGGLLNCFVEALRLLPDINIQAKDQSRLIEFMQLGVAVEQTLKLPKNIFISTYKSYRKEAIARTLDTSPIALAVIDYCNNSMNKSITASAQELFEKIKVFRVNFDTSWPKSAKGFADALRRASPALRELGIDCKCLGKRGSYVQWSITKIHTEE